MALDIAKKFLFECPILDFIAFLRNIIFLHDLFYLMSPPLLLPLHLWVYTIGVVLANNYVLNLFVFKLIIHNGLKVAKK